MLSVLPEPPPNLAEWLGLVLLVGAFIEACRRRLVNPILHEMREHATDHAQSRADSATIAHELAPNGSEYQLPGPMQGKPLRNLAISALIAIQHVSTRLDAHEAYSRQIVTTLNAERTAEGQGQLPTEGGGL